MLHSNMYNSMVKYVKQYSKKKNKQNRAVCIGSNFAFVLIWEQGKKISTQCELRPNESKNSLCILEKAEGVGEKKRGGWW